MKSLKNINKLKFFALLSSIPFESEEIRSCLKNIRSSKIAGEAVYTGKISNISVLMMNTGLGKVNAAHSLTAVMERYSVSHVINAGVGGAYPGSGLGIGDIAVALKEVHGDEGVITPQGWSGLKAIGIPLVQAGRKKYFNEFPFDKKFVKKVLNTLKNSTQYASQRIRKGIPPHLKGGWGDFQIKAGNFVTVSSVTGTRWRAIELEKRFNAICENMEGAAIAQVCAIYKTPFLEMRGISNIVGVRDKRKWDLMTAAENCQRAVFEILKTFNRG